MLWSHKYSHNLKTFMHLVSSHGREKGERDGERKAAEEEREIAGGPLVELALDCREQGGHERSFLI